MANPKIKTINECISVLVNGYEADVEEVADALKDKSLWADDVYDDQLSISNKTKKQKARDNVSSKVKVMPKIVLITSLEKKYCEYIHRRQTELVNFACYSSSLLALSFFICN